MRFSLRVLNVFGPTTPGLDMWKLPDEKSRDQDIPGERDKMEGIPFCNITSWIYSTWIHTGIGPYRCSRFRLDSTVDSVTHFRGSREIR
ncbi:hypothetical protein CEXT_79901 [Caerostris extrusa]|uniref:Uncharacterized protein n=1 Tax=Caerostris extrusa TaxID=172846 RepID=A0AAV4TF73_CAEEX|nr:hypothetical protein CEXT_79901 [Caerostris extrusa]